MRDVFLLEWGSSLEATDGGLAICDVRRTPETIIPIETICAAIHRLLEESH
jgi:hypothetical protein